MLSWLHSILIISPQFAFLFQSVSPCAATMGLRRPILAVMTCVIAIGILGLSFQYLAINGGVTSQARHRTRTRVVTSQSFHQSRARPSRQNGNHCDVMLRNATRGRKSSLKVAAAIAAMRNNGSLKESGKEPLEDTKLVIRVKHPKPSCSWQVHIWSDENRRTGECPCPGLECGINLVVDTSYDTLQGSDALLLLPRSEWDWDELSKYRPKGQQWIFYSQKSPVNTRSGIIPPEEHYADTYDYVMSYRFRESHLYARSGYFDTSNDTVDRSDTQNWAANRTRQVAWLASNCNSTWLHWNRMEFVKELSKLVDDGIYGKCGHQETCPKDRDSQSCRHALGNFKFYLSLQNCACRDYITDKLWNNAYLQDLVPIVFGPPRSDYEAVTPPNSFIHVQGPVA